MQTVKDIRAFFQALKEKNEYVIDKSGCQMLELVGASFIADEEAIFGTVNADYVQREIEWYKSQSLNIYDMPGGPPKDWVKSADPSGLINSNYGWVIWSSENFLQYEHVRQELKTNPDTRRAVMIYTRPKMWLEYNSNGMSDFFCTNAVQYFIRDKKLIALVQMRSNDAVFGYKNDRAWQAHIHKMLANDVGCDVGQLLWQVGSLHVYSRHFGLVG